MIVVGVCPTGRVDLAGRDAHRAQRGYQQGRLLATTAIGGAHCGQWAAGAGVAGAIGHMLMAPVVDLEGGIAHAQPLDTRLELVVEHLAAVVEVLVVDTHGHHKVPELALRH